MNRATSIWDFTPKIGKTIIFAKNHNHAEKILEVWGKEFPDYPSHYCQVIDNRINYPQSIIDKFSDPKQFPQIAISVDMLDTGIDVPEILNLVFFKKVFSRAKFWQMVGRGTRLCPGVLDGDDKAQFYIFDLCGNFAFFRMGAKGREVGTVATLQERMFNTKAEMVYKLQDMVYQTDELKAYRVELVQDLVSKVNHLNRDNFAVKQHLRTIDKFQAENGSRRSKKTSNTFEFTNYWADANNRVIADLVDFTKTFFAKHSILNILTKYSVYTTEELLLVMRPYQIVATERILNRIEISHNYHYEGSIKAGGYIWHSTGSGKTLTSFKTAQLSTALPYVDKVIFVVDRKDLDYQTMKEYDRFEKGAANGNNSTKTLTRQLENRTENDGFHDYRIIVTTIQKLTVFISQNKKHDIYNKHVVLIFDECHRSQFGKMHTRIVEKFNKYNIFGYTGTPIFPGNAATGGNPLLKTTEQAFGDRLHAYTIVDAINDSNVLPFRIDYHKTVKMKDGINDIKVAAIDSDRAMVAPKRINAIVSYILENFDRKTYRNHSGSMYTHRVIVNVEEMAATKGKVDEVKQGQYVNGFNSILAVSSAVTIDGQRVAPVELYYKEFKRQLEESGRDLKVATIFSFSQNEDDPMEQDEDFDTDSLDQSSRDFLDSAIADYNAMFGTTYDSSSDKFQNYYKDLSLRVKNREVDLLIVVNMFLTGFDATTLNTLWVDKNLRQHGLLQAFSRTNRILNSVKKFGNIVCFRDLEAATKEAVSLFGDKEAGGIVILRTFKDYMFGYEDDEGKRKPGYVELVEKLQDDFPLGEPIIGEENQKDFIRLFGTILKMVNVLSAFDEFQGQERLSIRDYQNYQSIYLDIRDEFRNKPEKENINDDIEFEIELIKQVEVNIDYIIMLVAKYHDSNCADMTILDNIDKAVGSSPQLRSKKELIESFIARVNTVDDVDAGWRTFISEEKEKALAEIIAEEKLKDVEARKFMHNAFRDGAVKTTGSDIDKILPAVSRFGGSNRVEKKQTVIDKLLGFFEMFFGIA